MLKFTIGNLISTEAEERQDSENDDDQADDVDNLIHGRHSRLRIKWAILSALKYSMLKQRHSP